MGFGSYDESEQGNQEVEDIDTTDAEQGEDFEGQLTVEGDLDTDELVDRLDEMREE